MGATWLSKRKGVKARFWQQEGITIEVPEYRAAILKMFDIFKGSIVPLSLTTYTYLLLPGSRSKPILEQRNILVLN
jgi:hypothetical protein